MKNIFCFSKISIDPLRSEAVITVYAENKENFQAQT